MAWRISCGMIRRQGVLASVLVVAGLGGCRGEAAAPSEPPKAVVGSGAPPITKEAPMTTVSPIPEPEPEPEPAGVPLTAEAVTPHFQRWWSKWSPEHLASNPLRVTLDERVAAGGTVKAEACEVLADHVSARAPTGSAELLFGDPAALRGRTDRCWWLHHDGMMGAGLGAALASDGRVLVVWVVLEG